MASATSGADARYTYDEKKLEELRSKAPWTSDPTYFKSVAVSPSAIMKMMMHCHSGVEKGLKKGGNPIEVMGLLLGRPDPSSPKTLVVTDVFPLPVEGFETRVIADDEDVVNHMIALGESMERTRREKFMGWYHSHPFDVGIHSHCFLSQTDLTTQLQWQRAEDPHGNPFLAIVIDPLRSLAKNVPEIKAFRAYPPEYNSPVPNQCPDGSIVTSEQARLELWGSCWNRYHELGVEYYMSGSARNVMGILTQNFLWMRTLGSTPMLDSENRQRYPERVAAAAEKLGKIDLGTSATTTSSTTATTSSLGSGGRMGTTSQQSRGRAYDYNVNRLLTSSTAGAGTSGTGDKGASKEKELGNACQGVVELATEKLHGNIVQVAKQQLFS